MTFLRFWKASFAMTYPHGINGRVNSDSSLKKLPTSFRNYVLCFFHSYTCYVFYVVTFFTILYHRWVHKSFSHLFFCFIFWVFKKKNIFLFYSHRILFMHIFFNKIYLNWFGLVSVIYVLFLFSRDVDNLLYASVHSLFLQRLGSKALLSPDVSDTLQFSILFRYFLLLVLYIFNSSAERFNI